MIQIESTNSLRFPAGASRRLLLTTCSLLALACTGPLHGQRLELNHPESTEQPAASLTSPILRAKPGRAEALSQLARLITLAALPREYEDRKHWGGTTERWDGLKISRDGLRIKTKRRKKEVNHGTWKMYRFRFLDPAEEFILQIDNVRPTSSGKAACDVTVLARLALFGRISEWQKGIQLYSLSANAEARVRLELECHFGLKVDPTKFPPDVILDPTVLRAQVDLLDFRLLRLSNLRGPVVKQLGRAMKKIAEEQLHNQNAKIPDKINRQIAKRQDRLRLSLQDTLEKKWSAWTSEPKVDQ